LTGLTSPAGTRGPKVCEQLAAVPVLGLYHGTGANADVNGLLGNAHARLLLESLRILPNDFWHMPANSR
jgi:hypothetical protein